MNRLMEGEFNNLKEIILRECRDGVIFYLPNSGNWGDALIRHGTIQFFNENRIKYYEIVDLAEIGRLNSYHEKKYLIYGGSGGWCRFWHHVPNIINKLVGYFSKIIVLPSTYEVFHNESNCIYFSRDCKESKANMPHSIFCHDMAFFIDYNSPKKGTGTGYFYRTDSESSRRIEIPYGNFDLSIKCNHYGDLNLFFDKIADYDIIHTDRLHVAIAACLLNRKTYLYPSAYFKNKAVYLSSMHKFFPNLQFIGKLS